jgi:hypothetical protein
LERVLPLLPGLVLVRVLLQVLLLLVLSLPR